LKKIAVVNDISGFGRCSLTAALPVISSFGVQCCPLVTGVYSNQTGYDSFQSVDLTDSLPAFIGEWKKLGASFDAIVTGFVTSAAQGSIIADFIDDFGENALVFVDPIMADDGEIYKGFDDARIASVTALCRKADVITPNLHELCLVAGAEFLPDYSDDEIRALCDRTQVPTVIVTGIKRGDTVSTAVKSGDRFEVFTGKKYAGSFSGTGDLLVSFVAAATVSGDDVFTAVKKACDFIEEAIRLTLKENAPADYFADGVYFEKLLSLL
jgi:pyridoxine kinase